MTKATAKIKPLRTLTIAMLTSLSSACTTLGPDYERPSMDMPESYKESPESTEPQINQANKHAKWWSIYNEQEQEKLITQKENQNYSLQDGAARRQRERELREVA